MTTVIEETISDARHDAPTTGPGPEQDPRPRPAPGSTADGQVDAAASTTAERGALHTASAGWRVAPAQAADRRALDALFAACSEESIRLRFFGRLRAFPPEYLDAALAGAPSVHDAVVAYSDDRAHLVGLASLVAATPGPPGEATAATERGHAHAETAGPAEMAVLVGDPWQRQGAGAAMITALLARARERGVARVRATVLPGRRELLAALSRRLQPEAGSSSYTREGLSTVYKLQ